MRLLGGGEWLRPRGTLDEVEAVGERPARLRELGEFDSAAAERTIGGARGAGARVGVSRNDESEGVSVALDLVWDRERLEDIS